MQRWKVLVVESDVLTKEGIRTLLEESTDLVFMGAADAVDVECVTNSPPDIVVLDMPAGRPMSFFDRLVRMPIPVLVFSEEDETMYAEEALRAGARGYLMKSRPAEQLLTALRTILAGDLYLSEQMKSRFLKRIADSARGS